MRRLTELARACGCAAKLSPQMLAAVLPRLEAWRDERLLVGFEGAEDAAVFQLTPELALVQTVDFFTPIVDDAEDFGAIAAANALSDIYAMGGEPLVALSVLGYPPQEPPELLERILRGGLAKLAEAGCSLGGGHSLRDEELKFGFSVTGTVPPDAVLRNRGARVGDALYLSKPIGTGVLTTALKRGLVGREVAAAHLEAAVEGMKQLNRAAAAAARRHHAHAVTDVTGFGLLGHAGEMARASGVCLRIEAASVPLLAGARDCALGCQSQGLLNNQAYAAGSVVWAAAVPEELRALLHDPQTSGGLLLSLPAGEAAPEGAGARIGTVMAARADGCCLEVV
jgi:selenide,water dikinase